MSRIDQNFLPDSMIAESLDLSPELGLYARTVKPLLDFGLALLALPVLLPVIAVLFVLTRRDGGPGFFGHERVGQNGKIFKCWKIRTMVPDAQRILAQHLAENPEAAAEWERDCKLSRDPRITPIGNFLRRSSLDELPQIWNVLKGEMSFVGPRPVTEGEMVRYSGYEQSYLAVRPGITGLWQVSGRNDVDYQTRVWLDGQYVANMSAFADLKILTSTFGVVLNRNGK